MTEAVTQTSDSAAGGCYALAMIKRAYLPMSDLWDDHAVVVAESIRVEESPVVRVAAVVRGGFGD